ncbi:hypothetical protein SARC_10116 [Sphaeroforma arctica JP610]|uniref:Uncharacterized protein n=1 Tax=Sphaeroforma arctica JP610 TaxID=667725 RepID=A0A0L0FKV4_9EUKA|nr:hypothetical protein SARC_10116 [Sphaeroforma arctica JP610]KNC77422.1 hypothetical protein SARC_10116 [Sphaeroforma arctica JP610]|eukprot:XP_014151324.1 hypothetical protein SARC_10116 [Sphaeroforma arctica JP610]
MIYHPGVIGEEDTVTASVRKANGQSFWNSAISVCSDGKCERYGEGAYENKYENEMNCPVDCKLDHRCGNGKSESTESCFTCQKDCGKCKSICGDGVCDSDKEGCGSCPRDCGRCDDKKGDGVCAYPLESICSDDCETETKKGKYKKVDGIRYKTLLNARPSSQGYADSSCENGRRDVPKAGKWHPTMHAPEKQRDKTTFRRVA